MLGQHLGVLAPCLLNVRALLFGGGSRDGGFFGTLGVPVPQNDSSRWQGGPWATPPCNE